MNIEGNCTCRKFSKVQVSKSQKYYRIYEYWSEWEKFEWELFVGSICIYKLIGLDWNI